MSFMPCMFVLNEMKRRKEESKRCRADRLSPIRGAYSAMHGSKPVACDGYILEGPARAQMATHALCNGVFSDDFAHFEQNHDAYPVEAQAVFKSIAELRTALGAFRGATENICIADEAVAGVRLVLAEEEAPKPDAIVLSQDPLTSDALFNAVEEEPPTAAVVERTGSVLAAATVEETAAILASASLNPPKSDEDAL
jgi:hypothetical protein